MRADPHWESINGTHLLAPRPPLAEKSDIRLSKIGATRGLEEA